MTLKELITALQALSTEHVDADGLPVVISDSQYGQTEVTLADIEVPYTSIGRWVVLS